MSTHPGWITYGPNENCTLALCPVSWSVYRYRPDLSANSAFLVLFALAMIAHVVWGLFMRGHRETFFVAAMVAGCISEIIGYGGRIMLWYNPFSFDGFMIQICCITFAPVFFCAAIYVLLSRVTIALDPTISRVNPNFWYWFFIPCDLVSLTLQAAGGALSSTSVGSDAAGVDISIAGLSFQVVTLFLFSAGCVDYAIRYLRTPGRELLPRAFRAFLACFAAAVVFIFVRCAYRIQELREGYGSQLMANQGLFIGLEGVMIVLAAFVLLGAMPTPAMAALAAHKAAQVEKVVDSDEEAGSRV